MKLSEIAKRAGKRILNASLEVALFPYELGKNLVYNVTHPIKFAKLISRPYIHPVKSFKQSKKRTIANWVIDACLVAVIANFLLPNYIKPENIKNTQMNIQYPTQVNFTSFGSYHPQTTDVDLKDKKLEKLISKETNYHFSQENKNKITTLLLEKSKKPLSELSVNESIELASDITGDILDYGYEGKQPTSVDEMLERGEGVCRHYTKFNIAVFNILKEQNKNISNTHVSECQGFADQRGLITKFKSSIMEFFVGGHAWNRVATVTDKDKILVTYIDPTWDDGYFSLGTLNAYNSLHKSGDEFEATVAHLNGTELQKNIWMSELTKGSAYENVGETEKAIEEYTEHVKHFRGWIEYVSEHGTDRFEELFPQDYVQKETKKLNELEKHIAKLKQKMKQ